MGLLEQINETFEEIKDNIRKPFTQSSINKENTKSSLGKIENEIMSNFNFVNEQIEKTNKERNEGYKMLIDEMNNAFNNILNQV